MRVVSGTLSLDSLLTKGVRQLWSVGGALVEQHVRGSSSLAKPVPPTDGSQGHARTLIGPSLEGHMFLQLVCKGIVQHLVGRVGAVNVLVMDVILGCPCRSRQVAVVASSELQVSWCQWNFIPQRGQETSVSEVGQAWQLRNIAA